MSTAPNVTDILAEMPVLYPDLFSAPIVFDTEAFSEALIGVFVAHAELQNPRSSGYGRWSRNHGRFGFKPDVAYVEMGVPDHMLSRMLVLDAASNEVTPQEALVLITGLISTAVSISHALTAANPHSGVTHRWQDTLSLMLGNEEYRELVESLTIDGVVLTDLVAAAFG